MEFLSLRIFSLQGMHVVISLVSDFSTADRLHHIFLLLPTYG